MEEIYTNIYKESRKRAGLEQIEAADLIHVSYSSLAKYEARINAVVPRDDIVRNMVIAYNDRNLAYKHIKASPLGEFLPDFSTGKSLTVAVSSCPIFLPAKALQLPLYLFSVISKQSKGSSPRSSK